MPSCSRSPPPGAAAGEQIDKWTDVNGTGRHGDRPGENVEAERLDIQSRPTDPARIAALSQARAEARRETREAAQAQTPPAEDVSPEERRRQEQERQQQCTMYKERLQSFLQSRRLYREDENGERVYLTEQEVQAARDRVQGKVEEYCGT
ncbi:MAG: hypothetical protein U5K76_09015 [Woeseiaceae bacterium]|nr:hypothetical protein [Woeseiaceae bacterium]